MKAGLLRLKTLWPFPDREVKDLAGSVRSILVPEMNRGQVADLVRLHSGAEVDLLSQTNGEVIEAHDIEARLEEAL
jgi:2-oxoglutarate ferredoxin oxidoreductase subunit alpha